MLRMVRQASIIDLFKAASVKRSRSNCKSAEKSSPPAKKLRSNDDETDKVLSPEQRSRMDDNRLVAKIKLQTKKTCALSPNIGKSWYRALEAEFNKPYFTKLSEFLKNERDIALVYPPVEEVFSWTTKTDINEIKVVILGQDPYHDTNQAHGLCFSVPKGIACPPSLVNMYKELKNDIGAEFVTPSHGNLTGWAEQGVLLLNAVLTVRAHLANSHKDKGWEQFTDAVIKWLNANSSGIIFLLWGAYAQKKGQFIDQKKHDVLKCAHPSPLSVHKGFFGCGHFSKTNELLKKRNKTPINWSHLPE